jgi:hypothetical protein
MRDYIQEACEQIDAAMFSGDAFMGQEHRKELREYIGRWERGMKEHEASCCPLSGEFCAERMDGCSPDWGGHGEPAFCHLK